MLCVDNAPVRGKQFDTALRKAYKTKPLLQATLSAKPGVEANITLRGKRPKDVRLVAVLFQEKAVTKCTAGENKGKTLHELFVVRALSKPLDLDQAFDRGATVKFKTPEGVKPDNLGVAFLLERGASTLQAWWTPLAR